MKRTASYFLAFMFSILMASSAFSANGPTDPAGKGKGILGFSFGPGIPFYGGSGF